MNLYADIKVIDSAAGASINIEGVIGVPEQLQFGSADERVATYGRFAASLAAIRRIQAPEIVVNIRSTGGDVNDALLIYDALRELDAKVITRCYGYVASAATIIAQAASEGRREISPSALYLIHCSESAAEGNSRSLSAAKELLDRTDERIAAIYAARSGRDAKIYAELMGENGGKGKWITAGEAVEFGLADRIIDAEVTNGAGELPVADSMELVRLCRMFGLTLPPSNEPALSDGRVHERGMKGAVLLLRRVMRRLLGEAARRERTRPPADACRDECTVREGSEVSACNRTEPSASADERAAELGTVAGNRDSGCATTGQPIPPAVEAEVPSVPAAQEASAENVPGVSEAAPVMVGRVSKEGLPHDKAVVIVLRTAQSEAFPTSVKAVEDPGMDERSPSPNEQAYILDALSMRSRM